MMTAGRVVAWFACLLHIIAGLPPTLCGRHLRVLFVLQPPSPGGTGRSEGLGDLCCGALGEGWMPQPSVGSCLQLLYRSNQNKCSQPLASKLRARTCSDAVRSP